MKIVRSFDFYHCDRCNAKLGEVLIFEDGSEDFVCDYHVTCLHPFLATAYVKDPLSDTVISEEMLLNFRKKTLLRKNGYSPIEDHDFSPLSPEDTNLVNQLMFQRKK